ncbi:MAG: S9 family peptidase [Halolamina sp.]
MSRAPSLEDRYDLRSPSSVAVSPDGERVAFVVQEADPEEGEYRNSLFVAPTDGSREPHRLTHNADAGDPTWGPDGDRLAFTAAREEDVELAVGSKEEETAEADEADATEESDGDEEPKSQVWLFDMALGGDARQLTAFEEGAGGFDWSPDGERLVVEARDPTEDQDAYLDGVREEDEPYDISRLQHKIDGQGYTDDITEYLFVVDLESRETTRLDEASGRGARSEFRGLQPAWGASDRIAFATYRGDDPDATYELDAYTIDPDGESLVQVTDGGLTTSGFRWDADGTRLAFSGSNATNVHDPTQYYVAEGADGDDPDVHSVSASLDRTTGYASPAAWVAAEELLAPIADEARTRLVALAADADDPERVFEAQGTGRTITSFDAEGGTVAVVLSHPNEGQDVFTLDAAEVHDDVSPTRVTNLNDELLDEAAAPSCERVHFENDDGVEVEGLVYRPDGFDPGSSEPAPLICHIHGGPTAYDAPGFNFDYAYWCGQGYVVLNVNYRGSTSYGRAFSESIRGKWGPREADDIRSGVSELESRGWVDSDRLFVTGFSQGGINTLYVVTRDDRFAAAAPEHGIYDFYANFGTADMHQWYVNDVGVPWEHEDAYRAMSSLLDVGDVETPLLITAGENDWRCPPTQAEQLYVQAKRAGVDARLLVYQNEHHNIGDPDRATHRLDALTGWFAEYDPGRSDEET